MRYQLEVGDGVAVLHSRGRSRAVVAGILGDETDAAGTRRLWLDRMVHAPADEVDGWELAGAVSTVLVQARAGKAS